MNKEYTLATAFDEIATSLFESGLSETAMRSIVMPLAYINQKLDVHFNENQVFIMAALLRNPNRNMTTEDIAAFAGVSVLKILDMQADIDGLIGESRLYCTRNPNIHNWNQTVTLPAAIFYAIRYNNETDYSLKNLTTEDILQSFKKYMEACDKGELDYVGMVKIIKDVLMNTQHLVLSRKLLALKVSDGELMLLVRSIELLVIESDDYVANYQYDDILPIGVHKGIVKDFYAKSGELYKSGLLEATDEDCETFRVTDRGKSELLSEIEVKTAEAEETEDSEGNDIYANDDEETVEKAMFYNETEEKQIADLQKILSPENFNNIKERMLSLGMRPGFTCLFYGPPGTGKTETVMQLAKHTGREIVQVNLANIRDCFFGESEKNIQKIFDDYKERVADDEEYPILLFNEADGIFGKRHTSLRGAADQAENTIQNIILQNMETFEGILIATTNLTGNLDNAFERRFLYKIEFQQPSAKVRKSIWQSLMPELAKQDAEVLAKKYDMSGGQIENIARKHLIVSILNGGPLTLEEIMTLCDSEALTKSRPTFNSHG